jgi:hypothetical protein
MDYYSGLLPGRKNIQAADLHWHILGRILQIVDVFSSREFIRKKNDTGSTSNQFDIRAISLALAAFAQVALVYPIPHAFVRIFTHSLAAGLSRSHDFIIVAGANDADFTEPVRRICWWLLAVNTKCVGIGLLPWVRVIQ